MTPRQRRQHNAALEKAAIAPRKSYLGRFTPLTRIQSGWIKSLLSVWGESMRGGTLPRMPKNHSCWHAWKNICWSDKALERFTEALNQAREEGLRGNLALKRAHDILWPRENSGIIDAAIHDDDVNFMEQAVLMAFSSDDPVYLVGLQFYTTRKSMADIAREIQGVAPWLTFKMAKDRAGWCLQIFRGKVFLTAKKQMQQ